MKYSEWMLDDAYYIDHLHEYQIVDIIENLDPEQFARIFKLLTGRILRLEAHVEFLTEKIGENDE